jgi:nucleoside-diphosphate-sugar epimerase
MKVLVAGATGFLGSHIVDRFSGAGHEVIVLKRSTSNTWRISDLVSLIDCYDLDLLSLDEIFSISKPDVVINCVCNYGRGDSSLIEVINANLIFGVALIQAAIHSGTKAIMNTGTLLPKTVNAYSLSKHQLVEWMQMNSDKIKVVNLRIEHMIGTRDDESKFVYWLISQMKKTDLTDKVKLTSGKQLRDFIDVEDVASAFLIICSKLDELKNFTQFDVASGNLISVKEFVYKVADKLSDGDASSLLNRLNFGAISYRDNDVMIPQIDNSSLIQLGWSIENTLDESIGKILKVS